jgi:hypothetical protein
VYTRSLHDFLQGSPKPALSRHNHLGVALASDSRAVAVGSGLVMRRLIGLAGCVAAVSVAALIGYAIPTTAPHDPCTEFTCGGLAPVHSLPLPDRGV